MFIQVDIDDLGLWYLGGFDENGAPILVSRNHAKDYKYTEDVILNLRAYYHQWPARIVDIKEVSSEPILELKEHIVFESKNWIERVNNSSFNNPINNFIVPGKHYLMTLKLEEL